MGAGHGGKSGRYVALEEAAEEYAFLLPKFVKDTFRRGNLAEESIIKK